MKKKSLYPDHWARTAYEIDYEALYEQGYRGIIFDIDNTLVLPNAPADARALALFARLRELGYDTVILSNNTGKRARRFAHEVGSKVVTGAKKPLPGKFRTSMELMGTVPETTLLIGDQIFTDIWGASNAKVTSILTDPLTKRELFWIRLKRYPEASIRRKARQEEERRRSLDHAR